MLKTAAAKSARVEKTTVKASDVKETHVETAAIKTDSEPRLAKIALRSALRVRRRDLGAAFRAQAAQQVWAHLFAAPVFASAAGVHCYLSWRDELDTKGILERCLALGKRVFVPLSGAGADRLAMAPWTPQTPMRTSAKGPPEPQHPGSAIEQASAVDLVLVPGLAFDSAGHRLGYGGGWYDQFLAALLRARPLRPPRLLGLGFAAQRMAAIPAEAHDILLDGLITEEGLLPCVSPASSRTRY